MKKVLYLAATLLELCALAGAYVFQYFTANRLGMVRWVNYNSRRWAAALPLTAVILIAAALLAALCVLEIVLFLKRRKFLKIFAGVMAAVSCILSLGCIGYLLGCSVELMRAYYFLCLLFLLAALIQHAKTLAGLRICRK